jgi:hypothetical protein
MAVESHIEMSCSTHFLTQCKFWQNYAIISLIVVMVSAAVLELKHFTGWEFAVKMFVIWGTATCVIWWAWVMKKLYDIAHWWFELHHHVNTATQLLQETKADIKDIKRLSAPAS